MIYIEINSKCFGFTPEQLGQLNAVLSQVATFERNWDSKRRAYTYKPEEEGSGNQIVVTTTTEWA